MWLNRCATIGFEGEFFALGDENTNYYMLVRRQPDHLPAVLRRRAQPRQRERRVRRLSPRQPEQSRRRDQHQRHHPLPRRRGALPLHHLPPGRLLDRRLRSCTTYHDRFRADFVAGYRYLDLEDQLGITETLTDTTPRRSTPESERQASRFLIHDQFNTQNSFNGGDLGMKFEFRAESLVVGFVPPHRLGLDALDGRYQRLDADHQSGVRAARPDDHLPAACWPSRTNIGHYTQDNFAVVPELDLNLGFQFTATRDWSSATTPVLEQRGSGGRADRSNVNSSLLPKPSGRHPDRRGDAPSVYLPEDRILGPGHQCRRRLPMVMNLRPLSSRWV